MNLVVCLFITHLLICSFITHLLITYADEFGHHDCKLINQETASAADCFLTVSGFLSNMSGVGGWGYGCGSECLWGGDEQGGG